eukprot:Lankesteria_metandrocarpae@DN5338_c0_g1_i12.p1
MPRTVLHVVKKPLLLHSKNVILHEDPTPQSERNIASKVIQHREDTNDDSSTPHNRRPSQDSSCSKTLRLDDTSHVGPPVANHNFHSPTGNLVPHTPPTQHMETQQTPPTPANYIVPRHPRVQSIAADCHNMPCRDIRDTGWYR